MSPGLPKEEDNGDDKIVVTKVLPSSATAAGMLKQDDHDDDIEVTKAVLPIIMPGQEDEDRKTAACTASSPHSLQCLGTLPRRPIDRAWQMAVTDCQAGVNLEPPSEEERIFDK